MALRWTASRDGKLRADMRIEVRVSKETWDWMRARSPLSEAKLLAWWRDAILGHSAHRFTVSANTAGELDVVKWDDVDWDDLDGDESPGGYAYCPHGLY